MTPNPFISRLAIGCLLLVSGLTTAMATTGLPGGRRPLNLELNGRWIGNGVAFSPYRDGQEPGGARPSDAEILADLKLVAPYWQLLLTYESNSVTESIVTLIHREHLPLRLLLGVWIGPDKEAAGHAANLQQIDTAIRLANQYPDIVLGVIVGNETCVDWSYQPVGPAKLIACIRQVRRAIKQPVTTADDYNFWNKPEAQAVAAEVDFINLHGYALWNRQLVGNAMTWTSNIYDSIKRLYPDIPILIGETGWATQNDLSRKGPNEEGTLMKGEVSVHAQEVYLRQHYDWVKQHHVPVILFEAFDENWKGGGAATPATVAEKHWGVFTANRQPKASFAAIIRDYYAPPAADPVPDQATGR